MCYHPEWLPVSLDSQEFLANMTSIFHLFSHRDASPFLPCHTLHASTVFVTAILSVTLVICVTTAKDIFLSLFYEVARAPFMYQCLRAGPTHSLRGGTVQSSRHHRACLTVCVKCRCYTTSLFS